MRLILLGAPGAGKGTISGFLIEKFKIVQLSSGDLLRAEVKKGSPVGKKAQAYMNEGKLVPDEIILESMKLRLLDKDCADGFILDGFPRTIAQADSLKDIFKDMKIKLDAVINLEVPEAVLLSRLTSRRTCSNPSCQAIYNIYAKPTKKEGVCDLCGSPVIQREDEREDVIKKRLETYKEKTEPLIKYYSGDKNFFSVPCIDSKECTQVILKKIGK